MKPEQQGDYVVLGTTRIPAVNIQVENVPGFVQMPDGRLEWYGIYFEILFENGALWVVSQGSEEPEDGVSYAPYIVVTEYPMWAVTQSLEIVGATHGLRDWKRFVDLYNEMRSAHGWGY